MSTQQLIHKLSEIIRSLRRQSPYLSRAFRLVRRAVGGLAAIWMVLLLVQGLMPVATVYLTRELVDGIAKMVGAGGGWRNMLPLLPPAGAMALVMIGTEMFQSVGSWVRTAQGERVQDYVQMLIHDQAMRLDMSFYDDPGYYDQLHRARIDALSRPTALMDNVGTLVQSLITLVAMGGVLLTFGIWIPLLLLLSTLPALVAVLYTTMRFHRWRLQNTTAMRKVSYYDMMLTQREAAAEMRLFGLGDYFISLFKGLRARLHRERVKLARNEVVAKAAASLVGLANMAGALVWMGFQVLKGRIGLGELALFYQAFNQGQRMMRSLLGSAGEIYRNIMFLENLFEFLDLNPKISTSEKPIPYPGLKHDLSFRDVTFRYPGAVRPALEEFSLQVPAGRITALVGENGAGKTTLIKLICRFYDPEKGRLCIDGNDIRSLSPTELRRQITVLFQDPIHYHDTVFNNIAFGDIDHYPDKERIEAAAKAAGADAPIGCLPDGYESVLGKWFGGAELSGGEWQRLALARAFLRKSEIIILDEPTSAMDSWAEADWLLRFRKLVAGRTTLIITHRFTTALQADIIHVMDRGRVIESGTHEELLAACGHYAVSWSQQMRRK